ncbi:MAG: PorT family protein [Bacteroidales bacterium]|nr:PorT family protein [Bacteroidales bacterium]
MMKRLFAFLAVSAAMLVAGKSYAQLSIRAGFAPETWKSTVTVNNTSTTSTSNLKGIFVGAHYNFTLTGDLGLSLGAQYRYNFSKESESGDVFGLVGGTVETKNTQSVLDVPVLLNYGLDLSDAMRLSIFAGPTLNLALAGNSHVTSTVTVLGKTNVTETDNDWYGDNTNSETLNLSATFGVNFTYMHFGLFAGYNLGLLDMNKADNISLKTAGFFVGLGYTL